MAALRELAESYMEASVRLRMAISEAKGRLKSLDGPARGVLAEDIRMMEAMLRDTREVGDLVRHYYEPAYYRDRKYVV